MSDRLYVWLAAAAGLLSGYVTMHSFLAHSWASIILWVVIGVVLLYFSPNRRAMILAGTAFGFFDIASWLINGFQGASDQLGGFLILTLGLSIFGALCGAAGAYLFYRFFRA